MTTPKRMTDADLNAYVDGELEERARVEMEAWLAANPDDAARVEAYRQQNRELHDLFDSVIDEPIPSEMPDLVMQSRPRSHTPVRKRIAAAVCLLLVGGAGGWGLHGLKEVPGIAGVPSFVERAIGAHLVYVAEVRHPVEVAANQEGHLVAWLSKRLGSPLRPPRLGSAGYDLVGGRLLEESGRPAAQFMY
ncbi:MAG: anti-sigma factor family protein [Alphaproteobacteria bacterium]